VELASDRPEELFPALHRAGAFKPLLLVLCILPGLYALRHGALDYLDSLWGLRSVAVLTAADLDEIVDPPAKGPEALLRWQPLLGNWLMAVCLRLFGSTGTLGILAIPFLSTAMLLGMCYALFNRVSGARLAFWMLLLVAFHESLLPLVSDTSPYALAIGLALAAFWAFLGHLARGEESVSVDLLLGGLALGLCMLAGGPLALVVVLILLLHVLGLRGERSAAKRGRTPQPHRVWIGWPALKSLSILAFTGFAVGGWWVLMMRYSYGAEFWSGWLTGRVHGEISAQQYPPAPATGSHTALVVRESVSLLGMLIGAVLLGVGCAIRELVTTEDERSRRRFQFLLAWWGCALVMFLASLRVSPADETVTGPLWRTFLLIPSAGCAALAFDEIARRRVRVEWVGAVTLAMMFLAYVQSKDSTAGGLIPGFWGGALWLAAAAVLIAGLHALCRRNETRQRMVLVTLVIAQVVANVVAGVWSVRLSGEDDRVLAAFRAGLSAEEGNPAWVLVTDDEPPLRLQFLLRSRWPSSEFRLIRSRDEVLALASPGTTAAPAQATPLVVEWCQKESRLESTPGGQINVRTVGNPQFYRNRILRAYRIERTEPE